MEIFIKSFPYNKLLEYFRNYDIYLCIHFEYLNEFLTIMRYGGLSTKFSFLIHKTLEDINIFIELTFKGFKNFIKRYFTFSFPIITFNKIYRYNTFS